MSRMLLIVFLVLAMALTALVPVAGAAPVRGTSESGDLEIRVVPGVARAGNPVRVKADYRPAGFPPGPPSCVPRGDDGDEDGGGDNGDGPQDGGGQPDDRPVGPPDGVPPGPPDGVPPGPPDGRPVGPPDDRGDDDGDRPETDTAGRPETSTVLVVDYGDGSEPETMTVRPLGPCGDFLKADADHTYDAEGTYDVTVTAIPETAAPEVATATVRVGPGSMRVAGPDRFSTADEVAVQDFPDDGSADAVLLARGDAFADALASAGPALVAGAPVLLTGSADVPAATLDQIARALGDDGVVYLLGGEAAIGPEVEAVLGGLGYETVRIAGSDRVETAVALARFLLAAGVEIDEVVLATAGDFPDALSGAALAARASAPVLLTGSEALDPRVAALLAELGDGTRVLVTGGRTAISDAVVADLEALGLPVERLAGADRFETAARVADARFPAATEVVVATGGAFPDALTGAAHAARSGAPVLLVGDELPASTRAYLAAGVGRVDVVTVLGGTQAVSDAVLAEIEAVLGFPPSAR